MRCDRTEGGNIQACTSEYIEYRRHRSRKSKPNYVFSDTQVVGSLVARKGRDVGGDTHGLVHEALTIKFLGLTNSIMERVTGKQQPGGLQSHHIKFFPLQQREYTPHARSDGESPDVFERVTPMGRHGSCTPHPPHRGLGEGTHLGNVRRSYFRWSLLLPDIRPVDPRLGIADFML